MNKKKNKKYACLPFFFSFLNLIFFNYGKTDLPDASKVFLCHYRIFEKKIYMEEPRPLRAGISGSVRKLPALPSLLNGPPPPAPSEYQRSGASNTWKLSEKGKLKNISSHLLISRKDTIKTIKNSKGKWIVKDTTGSSCQRAMLRSKHDSIPRQIKSINVKCFTDPTAVDLSSNLSAWMSNYQNEQVAFSSVATWAELTLKKIVADTAHLHKPNPLRTAICCMILDRVTSLFGRYEPVLTQLKDEIYSSIYHEWPSNTEFHGVDLPALLPLPRQVANPTQKCYRSSDTETECSETSEPVHENEDSQKEQTCEILPSQFDSQKNSKNKKVTVHDLSERSSYFQVCRQLLLQENALTLDRSRDIPITAVLNAAINRWQLSLLRIYLQQWRTAGKKERAKKVKIRSLTEKLFFRKRQHLAKDCFQQWRDVARCRRSRTKEDIDMVRAKGINIKMGKRLLELESGWTAMQANLEYYQSEKLKCQNTLRKLHDLLVKYNLIAVEQPDNDDNSNHETELKNENSPRILTESNTNGKPSSDTTPLIDSNSIEDDQSSLTTTTKEVDVVVLDKRIGEALKSKEVDTRKALDSIISDDPSVPSLVILGKKECSPPVQVAAPVNVDSKPRIPFSEVLRWVNYRVHSLVSPYKKITNFVTDFQSCVNYAYLLKSLGGETTMIPNHTLEQGLVQTCTNQKIDEQTKAKLIIEIASRLLEKDLKGIIKASDILKAKSSKNSGLIFMLHEKFAYTSKLGDHLCKELSNKTIHITSEVNTKDRFIQNTDTGGGDLLLRDSLLDNDSSDSSDSDNVNVTCSVERDKQNLIPTEEDYNRWCESYPEDDVLPIQDIDQREMIASLDLKNRVTFGDILSGCSKPSPKAESSPCPSTFIENIEALPEKHLLSSHESKVLKLDKKHVLLKWLSKTLSDWYPGNNLLKVSNFTTDLSDYVRYTLLIAKLFPIKYTKHRMDDDLSSVSSSDRFLIIKKILSEEDTSTVVPSPDLTQFDDIRQSHMIFLSSLYSLVSSRRPSKSVDPINVVPSLKDISRIVGDQYAEECRMILVNNALMLQKILVNLVCSSGGFGQGGSCMSMNCNDWERFCSQCAIPNCSASFPPLGQHPLSEPSLALLRIARESTKGPVKSLRSLIEDSIIPHNKLSDLLAFRASVDMPEIRVIYKRHMSVLKILFSKNISSTESNLVSWTGYHSLLAESDCFTVRFTPQHAGAIFATMQSHENGLSFDDFLHSLSAIAVYHDPMPWNGIELRTERFVSSLVDFYEKTK